MQPTLTNQTPIKKIGVRYLYQSHLLQNLYFAAGSVVYSGLIIERVWVDSKVFMKKSVSHRTTLAQIKP